MALGRPVGVGVKGPGEAVCRLSERQLDRLRTELEQGPAAHGWADQRWTLARVALLIGRLFHVRYTLRGASYLLHRIGFTPQVPAHRAVERNEQAIATWRTGRVSEPRDLQERRAEPDIRSRRQLISSLDGQLPGRSAEDGTAPST